MSSTSVNGVCPLCRKQASSGANGASPTRLCPPCQSLARALLPEKAAVIPTAAQPGGAAPQPALSPVVVEARPDEWTPEFLQPADVPEHLAFDDVGAADYPPELLSEQEEVVGPPTDYLVSLEQGHPQPEPFSLYADERDTEDEPELPQAVDEPELPSEPTPDLSTAALADDEAQLPETPEAEKTPADPWEDPLPAWEYSTHEWPIVVDTERPSPFKKYRGALAAFLAVALAGAGYFLVYKTLFASRGERQSPPAQAAAMREPSAAPNPQPPAVTPASSPAPPPQEPPPAPPRESAAPAGAGEGPAPTHTLQVESTPDENAANQKAERLKRAGIPAYVVAADLGKRGTWYRIRIGRFTSAEDAQKFAAQSRSRARAAGIEISPVVQPYEKN